MAAAVLGLSAAVRLPPLLMTDFPLGDGGLFAVMIEELRANGLAPPPTTSYNNQNIPFAYPPLGLVAGALLALMGVPVLEVLRWLPLTVSCLVPLAVLGLAREVCGPTRAATVAALVFPLLPFSFSWIIKGGGVTRSFGLLFFVLSAWATHALFRQKRAGLIPIAGLSVAGAILSHPETGLFAVVTVALFLCLQSPSWWGLRAAAAVGATATVLSAPWWVTVLQRHGLAPFLAALAAGEHSWSSVPAAFLFVVTGEPYLQIFNVLAIVGAFGQLASHRFVLPAWAVLALLVVPRSAHTPLAVIVALLAGVALGQVVDLGIRALTPEPVGSSRTEGNPKPVRAAALLVGFCLAHAFFQNALHLTRVPPPALGVEERQAMAWVAAHTPAHWRFLVVSPADLWSEDLVAEWFPALAKRQSVATPQGLEWVRGPAYPRAVAAAAALRPCTGSDVACLARWEERTGLRFDAVFCSLNGPGPQPPHGLLRSLASSGQWVPVYRQNGVWVFRHVSAGSGAPG